MIYVLFLINLALTVLAEGTVMALLTRRRDYVAYSALCNLLTNPAVNLGVLLAVRCRGAEVYWAVLAGLEILAVVVEAVVLKTLCRISLSRAALYSLAMNAASFAAGLALDPVLVRILT